MFALGNFVAAVATLLKYLLNAYYWVLIIRVLLSWVHADPYNPIVQFLMGVTEPVLRPIRRCLRMEHAPIDLSPVIAILGVWFLEIFLIRTLFDLSIRLR